MRQAPRLPTLLLMLLAILLAPAITLANSINLYSEPKEQSKIVGNVDLSTGIIPIFSPKNSDWTKVADPRNGNTGWVKNSELKDSKGNIITFSQKISESGSGQSVQMMQSSGSFLTPEQKKKLEAQALQAQQTANETLLKAQKNAAEVLEGLKKLYQQQLQIMEQSGFPVLMPGGNSNQPQGGNMGAPMMRQQQGMQQPMQGQQFNPRRGQGGQQPQMMPGQPPFPQQNMPPDQGGANYQQYQGPSGSY